MRPRRGPSGEMGGREKAERVAQYSHHRAATASLENMPGKLAATMSDEINREFVLREPCI